MADMEQDGSLTEVEEREEEQQEQQSQQQSTASAPQAAPAPAQQNKKGGNKKQPEHPCVACGKNVSSNAVQCTMCTLWCHRACTNLSNEAFKGLEAQVREVGVAYWACRACLSFANKVNRQLQATSKRQDEVEARVDENVRRTENNSQEIVKLREELNRVRMALESERGERNDMLCEELRDRELRRNNIVIHGLQEPSESFNRARIEQDRIECGNLLAAMGIRMRQEDLRFCRRVGERGQDSRPIIIGLRTEEEKRTILERARLLRGTRYDNVAIVPDMTKMQRRAEDMLTSEAASRNEQLTADDRSKNLKWLVVGRRGEKRLIKGTEREGQNNIRREIQLGDFVQHPQGAQGGGSRGNINTQIRPEPTVPLPSGRGGIQPNNFGNGNRNGFGNRLNNGGGNNTFGSGNNALGGGTHGGYYNEGYGSSNRTGYRGAYNNGGGNYNRGGGSGNGGGIGNGEIELGARRKSPLQPPLLSPLRNGNANYTPIQHRRNLSGGGGNYNHRGNGGGYGYNTGYNMSNSGSYNNDNGGNQGNPYSGNIYGEQGNGGGGGNYSNDGMHNPVDSGVPWTMSGNGNGNGSENNLLGDQDRPDGAAAAVGHVSPDGPMRQRLGSKRGRDGTDITDGPPRTRSRQ
jgi:hypothetical protein